MKFKFYASIIILALSFDFAFSQSARYIPDSSKMIISFDINSISSNLNKTYAEIVDDIIEHKTGYKIINEEGIFGKSINSFVFNKKIRIILSEDDDIGFIIPYKQKFIDISLIIKQLISKKDYDYLKINEKIAVGFKNNLLCISYSDNPDSYLEEIITNDNRIRNEAFFKLDREINDISLWADADYLLSFLEKNNEYYNEYNYNLNPSITISLKDFRYWKEPEAYEAYYYYTPRYPEISIRDLIKIFGTFLPFIDWNKNFILKWK